ncbi:MAG: hypothetical protein F6J97_01570 [Leptolyngbya sp. SIO4C1]|nr:hypothetical protein [Leptolyngbya sp. SIO4C1]
MAETNDESTKQATGETCPVCGVTILGDEVRFSSGSPGTRARLYARVCQYAQDRGCINKDPSQIGQVSQEDGYTEGEDVKLSGG